VRKNFTTGNVDALVTGTILQESDLFDATIAGSPTGSNPPDNGFYMKLQEANGEKVLRNSDIAGGNTLFTTYSPDPANCATAGSDFTCGQSGAGLSRLYEVDYLRVGRLQSALLSQ
jgi:hypothetical protein